MESGRRDRMVMVQYLTENILSTRDTLATTIFPFQQMDLLQNLNSFLHYNDGGVIISQLCRSLSTAMSFWISTGVISLKVKSEAGYNKFDFLHFGGTNFFLWPLKIIKEVHLHFEDLCHGVERYFEIYTCLLWMPMQLCKVQLYFQIVEKTMLPSLKVQLLKWLCQQRLFTKWFQQLCLVLHFDRGVYADLSTPSCTLVEHSRIREMMQDILQIFAVQEFVSVYYNEKTRCIEIVRV